MPLISLQNRNLYLEMSPEMGASITKFYDIKKNNDIKGPPFYVNRDELTYNFQDKFDISKISKSSLSIKQRMDIELYAEYQKK